MIQSAVILVEGARTDAGDVPRALLQVGGLTLLERQLRQLKKAGITNVHILSSRWPELLRTTITRFSNVPERVSVSDGRGALASDAGPDDHVLVLEDGIIADTRIVEAMARGGHMTAIATFAPRTVMQGKGAGTLLRHNNRDYLFASVARVPCALIDARDRASEGPLREMLGRLVSENGDSLWDISETEEYVPDRRRKVSLLWQPVMDQVGAEKATRAMVTQSQKGCLDWPARWLHVWMENALTLALTQMQVKPDFLSVFNALLGLLGAGLFATGQIAWALGGAIAVCILRGVEDRLTQLDMSPALLGGFGDALGKFVEYSWYLGIAWWITSTDFRIAPVAAAPALAALLILLDWARSLQESFFYRMTGGYLDDAGKVERLVNLIGARRNTIFWGLIPFAFFGAWALGFWVAALYMATTFFATQWCFYTRTRQFLRDQSPTIAKNFRDSE